MSDRYAKWDLAHSSLPAWRALSMPAREIYHWLKIDCYGKRNGSVYKAPERLAELAGCNVKTVRAALADLQAKGFLLCTKLPARGSDGTRHTAHWRLTMLPTMQGTKQIPPTGEAAAWSEGNDFHVKAYFKSSRAKRKGDASRFEKQKPTPQSGLRRLHNVDFEGLRLVGK